MSRPTQPPSYNSWLGWAGLAPPLRAGPVPEYPARAGPVHRLARTRHTRRPLSQSVDQRDTLGVLWGARGDGCRAAAASRGSSCPRRSGRCRRNCVPRDHATAPSAAPPMRARSSSSAQRYPRRRSCDAIGCDGCRRAAARAGALRSLGQSSPTSRLRGLSVMCARRRATALTFGRSVGFSVHAAPVEQGCLALLALAAPERPTKCRRSSSPRRRFRSSAFTTRTRAHRRSPRR